MAIRKDDYGIIVDTMTFADANIQLAALQKGDVDIISEMPYVAMQARLAGIDLIAIYTRMGQLDSFLVVRPEITSIDQLAGKTVALGSLGSGASWSAMQYLFLQYPDLKGAVNTIIMKGSETRAAALIRGQIDATWCEMGDLQNLAAEGINSIISLGELYPDCVQMAWYVRSDYLKKNPDIVQALVESLIKGNRHCYDSTADFIELGKRKLPFAVNEGDLQFALQYYRDTKFLPVNLTPTKEVWDKTMQYFLLSGTIKQEQVDELPYDKMVDLSFATKAIEKLGEYQIK